MVDPGFQHAGEFQRLAVNVEDMAGGVQHPDGAVGRDLVQIVPADAPAAIVDRVQRPSGERRGRVVQPGGGRAQPLDYLVDRFEARPHRPLRIHSVEEAAIDIGPEGALHRMAVAFDQAGHQHLVGEPLVQRIGAPPRQFVQRARADDAAVAHRDMACVRPGRIHGDDLARGIDDGHASGPPGMVLVCCRRRRSAFSACVAIPTGNSARLRRRSVSRRTRSGARIHCLPNDPKSSGHMAMPSGCRTGMGNAIVGASGLSPTGTAEAGSPTGTPEAGSPAGARQSSPA